MNLNIDTINNAFKKWGISTATAQYSITEYSLNTDLSFKFNGLNEFASFLGIDTATDTAKTEMIKAKIIEAGVNPESFFYVNFYKSKVAEL
ncbi:hypothetical protein GR160_01670 [Flavobacterium sp. Sd200]|uniref:hypothetical protein n=1 Tax=Flavobacterium sp. Sd200 TaxID=2692211 RepID=UPI00136F763E|nr:hypothetical protein [Flavobacterium sp. Sd200]MXN89922.1 hypothetical protein [Flavobacterium sp. Sd200]